MLGVKSTFTIIFIIAGLTLVSCSKKTQTQRQPQSIVAATSKTVERYVSDPLIVKLSSKEDADKLAAVSVSITGEEGIKDIIKQQKEHIQTLLITTLADFTFEKLKSESGKMVFQQKILENLSLFVDKKKFLMVHLMEVREI